MTKADALQGLERKKDKLFALSRKIWENPELQFREWKAVDLYAEALEQEGFHSGPGRDAHRHYGRVW